MQAIELPEFQTRHREVIDRHRQLEQEREALVRQRQELAVNNRLARRVESFASRVRQGIDALDFEQRQRLVRLLVEEVRVTGPSVQIHLRIPLDEPSPADGAAESDNAANPQVSSQFRLRSHSGMLPRLPEIAASGRLDGGRETPESSADGLLSRTVRIRWKSGQVRQAFDLGQAGQLLLDLRKCRRNV